MYFKKLLENENIKRKPPTIWILWMQGWNENTPWLVWEVRRSWEGFNHNWRVVALDANTLSEYVDMSSGSALNLMSDFNSGVPIAVYSDMVRLALLSAHGGVWADATMLCMTPLDEWVYDSLLPCGLWMYHGRDRGNGLASWFIISIRQSYIIQAWARECFNYWKIRGYKGVPHDYFWMDLIFNNLYQSDREFERQWKLVPYLWADSFGQAHLFAGKTDHSCTQEMEKLLLYSPPHAIKLSRHVKGASDGPNGFEHTCLVQAVSASRKRRKLLPSVESLAALSSTRHTQWQLGESVNFELPKLPDKIVVVADCGCKESIDKVVELCSNHGIMPLVYDKCGFCTLVPNGVFCRPLRNVGRDLGTFLWFVSRYYNLIPDSTIMYFTAGNMKKHNRADRLDSLFNRRTVSAGRLGDQENFKLDKYDGVILRQADQPNFRLWYEKYVGSWDPEKPGVCFNALIRTTGKQIRMRPRTTYINVYNELSLADGLESVHFVERCIHALFISD